MSFKYDAPDSYTAILG